MKRTNHNNTGAPEYVATSLGPPDWRNVANRVHDLAALLASHGLNGEAEYLVSVYGSLRARLAVEQKRKPKEVAVAA